MSENRELHETEYTAEDMQRAANAVRKLERPLSRDETCAECPYYNLLENYPQPYSGRVVRFSREDCQEQKNTKGLDCGLAAFAISSMGFRSQQTY